MLTNRITRMPEYIFFLFSDMEDSNGRENPNFGTFNEGSRNLSSFSGPPAFPGNEPKSQQNDNSFSENEPKHEDIPDNVDEFSDNENKPRNTENINENFPGENEPNSQNDDDYFSESEQKPPLGMSIMKILVDKRF